MAKNKRSFQWFLNEIHNMTMWDYHNLDADLQEAIEIEYIDRYGVPIKWYD